MFDHCRTGYATLSVYTAGRYGDTSARERCGRQAEPFCLPPDGVGPSPRGRGRAAAGGVAPPTPGVRRKKRFRSRGDVGWRTIRPPGSRQRTRGRPCGRGRFHPPAGSCCGRQRFSLCVADSRGRCEQSSCGRSRDSRSSVACWAETTPASSYCTCVRWSAKHYEAPCAIIFAARGGKTVKQFFE